MNKYLHVRRSEDSGFKITHIDHRVVPEVRAMFASMASRLPAGGIHERYRSVVRRVAKEAGVAYAEAEESLTRYPIPPTVQAFFDEFVGAYGHASIQEMVGDPAIYIEGVSWFTDWLLFDSPLVRGQEFSTRAVRVPDWPKAREALPKDSDGDVQRTLIASGKGVSDHIADVHNQWFQVEPETWELHNLHVDWLAVFDAEVDWWKGHFSDLHNRIMYGIGDKEPFRPALDRARWALPGTAATGACFTSDLRERSRQLTLASKVGKPSEVWGHIVQAYKESQPGIAGHALRKFERGLDLPAHLQDILKPAKGVDTDSGVVLHTFATEHQPSLEPYTRTRKGTYADPWRNRDTRMEVALECSLATARDWHRHRSFYPWTLNVVLDGEGALQPARGYEPKSELAKEQSDRLWRDSTRLYKRYMQEGDVQRAALALPLGTRMVITACGGYQHGLYMAELRAYAHGANFEYKRQALALLQLMGYPNGD
jgi:hypothetical protein